MQKGSEFRVWGEGMRVYRSNMELFGPLVLLGLYWDNGKENGNYYLGFRV